MGEVLSRPAEEEGQEELGGNPANPAPPRAAARQSPPGPDHVPSTRRRIKAKPTRIAPLDAAVPTSNRTAAAASSSGPRRSKRKAAHAAAAAPAAEPPAQQQQQGAPAPAPAAPHAGVQPRTAGIKRKEPEPCTGSPGGEPDAEAMLQSRRKFLGLALLAMGAVRGLAPFPPMPPRQQQRRQQPIAGEAMQPTAPVPGSCRSPAAVEAAMSPDVQPRPASPPPAWQGRQEQRREEPAALVQAWGEPMLGEAPQQQQQQFHNPAPMDTREDGEQPMAEAWHEEARVQFPPEEQERVAPPADQQHAVQPAEQGQPAVSAEQEQPAEPADAPTPAHEPLQGEEGWQAALVPRPLSANTPLSRSQLRQQLQLQSLRSSGASSPAVRAAGRMVGTPPAAGSGAAQHSGTRGQRLLGLVRQQQVLHSAGLPAEGAQQPAAGGLDHGEQQQEQAAAPSAEQLLPESPAVQPGEAVPSPQPAPGDSTPCQTQRTTPPTPATAEPSSAQRGGPSTAAAAPAAAAGACAGSPCPVSPTHRMASLEGGAPSPAAAEAAVRAALQQVDNLLADLRADSPQPPGWQAQAGRAAEPSLRQHEDEAESTLKQGRAASPAYMPEVTSRPREAGGDNFPGFWRQPVPGSQPGAAAPLQGKQPAGHGGEEQAAGGGQERARRVRFSMPEAEAPAAAAAPPLPEQQQQTGAIAPLVVAPPVLPASAGWAAEGRPGTPAKAKPAVLPMPQPPAYSRFGAASFRRGGYAGPAARRQALVSFVSDGGAPCFALPSGLPIGSDGEAGEAQHAGSDAAEELGGGGGSASAGSDLVIPRRLQHREGLRRRRGMHERVPPAPQGPELLVQEVREAYMNAKLAEHAGEPWARLDMAGCELEADGGHAAALAQVSSQLEGVRGAAAVKEFTAQLESEWQHLKRMRQYATQRAVPAAAPAVDDAGLPRGILKHRSRLGGSGQLPAGVAAAAAAAIPAAQPTAEEPAAQPEAQRPAAGPPPGTAQPAAPQPAAAAQPAAAVDPGSFEAVLAADVAEEEPPLLHTAELALAAAAAQPVPAAPAVQPAGDQQGAAPMDVDAAASGSPMAAAGTPGPAGAHALPAGGHPVAADWAAPGEGGEVDWDMTPRPVELTPGPALSRGAKLLQRLGTPVAATKVQQLLAGAAGVQGRKAGSSPFQQQGGPIRLLPAVGGVSSVHRRGMSRGERLLASVRGSGAAAGGMAMPAAGPPPGEPADGGQVAANGLPEEGPAVAAASCLLNT